MLDVPLGSGFNSRYRNFFLIFGPVSLSTLAIRTVGDDASHKFTVYHYLNFILVCSLTQHLEDLHIPIQSTCSETRTFK